MAAAPPVAEAWTWAATVGEDWAPDWVTEFGEFWEFCSFGWFGWFGWFVTEPVGRASPATVAGFDPEG